MHVWIVPSETAELDTVESVCKLLSVFRGPIVFDLKRETCPILNPLRTSARKEKSKKLKYNREDFHEQINYLAVRSPEELYKVFTWDEIFKACKDYRRLHGIPESDLLLLLTEHANEKNWFSCFDPAGSRNGFVHLDGWDQYGIDTKEFPVAYCAAELVLQQMAYKRNPNFADSFHSHPIGCMNDLCESKKDILLKLRTSDICGECTAMMSRAGISDSIIDQVLRIFEGIGKQMKYSTGFRSNMRPGALHVDSGGLITLPDCGNMLIDIPSQETALYLLFLEHPEGIILSTLPGYYDSLLLRYLQISGSDDLVQQQLSIQLLVNQNNQVNTKISRIKKAFEDKLGEELAGHYIISGTRGGRYSIKLDRGLVVSKMVTR